MNIIPFKKKNSIPVSHETSLTHPTSDFRSEMNRVFDRFFHNPLLETTDWADDFDRPLREFMPTMDLSENDNQITIRAEAPGMSPDDIDISVSGNVLTIRGEKKESTHEEGEDFYHCERRFGSFTRSVELPTTADLDSITAEQSDGVLTLGVKKLTTAHPKKIDVKIPKRELAGMSS